VLDFGFGELLLLGAVALIVLGPEKLPHAARMAGAWYGRIRRTLANVQAEIANEVHLSEMRQQMNDELSKIRDTKDSLIHEMHEIGIHPHLGSEVSETEKNEIPTIVMSQETDWSHGIEAPFKPDHHGYYFFFVPHTMYTTLIPSAPYLPKSPMVQNKRNHAKSTDLTKP
jgi:Tat protein translocase TatB subunit